MNTPVIELSGIHKHFGSKHTLRGIDLVVPAGTILGLMGKNGAGKSTLIKILLGLLKPSMGAASIFGEDAWNLGADNKQRIGYVPQTLTGFRWMTAKTYLEYVGAFYETWNPEKARTLVGAWELDPDARLSRMSEGEVQKLSIIQALAHEPDLLVFDEPVASLDPLARRKFMRELVELNMNDNRTMLFSTHIASDLERVASDIAILKDGRVAYHGDFSSLQERIRRLHISSDHALPQSLSIPKATYCEIAGTTATATVDGMTDVEIQKLRTELSANITVEQLNLEEIFMETHR